MVCLSHEYVRGVCLLNVPCLIRGCRRAVSRRVQQNLIAATLKTISSATRICSPLWLLSVWLMIDVSQMVAGTVVMWGDNQYGQGSVPDGLSNVVAVAAAPFHSLALFANGKGTAWGRLGNDEDIYGAAYVPADLTNIASFA